MQLATERIPSGSILLRVPARLKRAGMETRFLVEPAHGHGSRDERALSHGPSVQPDPALVRTLARAHALRDLVLAHSGRTLAETARERGLSASRATRLLRLVHLSPRIVRSILDGSHPPTLSVRKLMTSDPLPIDWIEQERRLGYGP